MANDPLAGRGDRAPERSRMLVATEDGIFLWPGSALLARCGNGFTLMEPREINSHLSTFFGSDGIYVPLQPILDNARDQMRVGQVASVQRSLDRLPLPPVSSNGARLMRAIARRQDLAVPDVVIAPAPSGTVWSDRDVENVAKLHDGAQNKAKELAKIFNPGSAWDPGKHPRWPPGQSDGGQFRPNDSGEGGSPLLPVADRKP